MDMQFANENFAIVRKPVDRTSGKVCESSAFAFFPGTALSKSEPDLVVKVYDSLLNQRPDTAMFLYEGYGSDPLLNRVYAQRLQSRWNSLGKPTLILATPEDRKFFISSLGEIPTVSLYDELVDFRVSGGCNSELYRLTESDQSGFEEALKELASMMGVVFCDDKRAPVLTSSIEERNQLKKNGSEAVHILELIFGMGESNEHLAHTHSENHDHDKAPEIRERLKTPAVEAAQERLFDANAAKENLQSLHDALLSFFWNE